MLDMYQVNAFSRGPFTGNPAAVVPLDDWIDDHLMQAMAEQNNLSETAFFVQEHNTYHIRWFTPTVEVSLCGHATLASAYVLFEILGFKEDVVHFTCLSGPISVQRDGDLLTLDFPTDHLTEESAIPEHLKEALDVGILELYKGRNDFLCIISSKSELAGLKPDFGILNQVSGRGVLVSAEGNGEFDFVSRGFFPQSGINEDPATGSAHTTLTPYWSKRLNKRYLTACQLSARKGYFQCENKGDRTLISGHANLYLTGKITT